MRKFICTVAVVSFCAFAAVVPLKGQDVGNMQQNAATTNLMYNHQPYPGQMGFRRGMFRPAYYGPVYGYGPYYQGYSIASPEIRRFGSSPAPIGVVVPSVGPRVGPRQ